MKKFANVFLGAASLVGLLSVGSSTAVLAQDAAAAPAAPDWALTAAIDHLNGLERRRFRPSVADGAQGGCRTRNRLW